MSMKTVYVIKTSNRKVTSYRCQHTKSGWTTLRTQASQFPSFGAASDYAARKCLNPNTFLIAWFSVPVLQYEKQERIIDDTTGETLFVGYTSDCADRLPDFLNAGHDAYITSL